MFAFFSLSLPYVHQKREDVWALGLPLTNFVTYAQCFTAYTFCDVTSQLLSLKGGGASDPKKQNLTTQQSLLLEFAVAHNPTRPPRLDLLPFLFFDLGRTCVAFCCCHNYVKFSCHCCHRLAISCHCYQTLVYRFLEEENIIHFQMKIYLMLLVTFVITNKSV